MDFYSVWPTFALLAVLFAMVSTPLFAAADSPPIPTSKRVVTLDGLRGFLALGVFFHHCAIYHSYLTGKPWAPPSTRFYSMLGPLAVSIFFMITGFLFWSQVIAKRGRPDLLKLYIGRVFRIGPIYWVAIGIMIISVFALTKWRLNQTPLIVSKEIFDWLFMGAITGKPINGFAETGVLIANVTWSLKYEWMFYASLFLTSVFARWRLSTILFPAVGFVATIGLIAGLVHAGHTERNAPFVALFFAGMLTASIRSVASKSPMSDLLGSVLAVLALGFVFVFFDSPYEAVSLCLLAVAFFLIASGASIFGLLKSRPARRLGDISFGIYLLQGLVLAITFAVPGAVAAEQGSAVGHWIVVGLSGVTLLVVSTVAHVLIERPGISAGELTVRRIKKWLGQKT